MLSQLENMSYQLVYIPKFIKKPDSSSGNDLWTYQPPIHSQYMFPARDAMWAVAKFELAFFKIRGDVVKHKLQIQDDKVDFNKVLITG